MKNFTISLLVVWAVSACAPAVPDSAAGVGFDSYETYQRRKAVQTQPATVLPPPANVSSEVLTTSPSAATEAASVAAETRAALAPAAVPAESPAASSSNEGISNENNFDAVSATRSIESDAERLARIRAEYQVVEPKALPSRSGTAGPNLAEYALRTTNVPGQSIYKRSAFNTVAKSERNCALFPSPDLAQTAFLQNGGPERDRKALDPDGDGFACSWTPIPFRKAVQG